MSEQSENQSEIELPEAEPICESANQTLQIIPTAVLPAGEDEVAAMLAEQVRFSDEPEMKAMAVRLLDAGHTVQSAARKLRLRASTVWSWSNDPDVSAALASGRERRRSTLGQGLENAAETALSALVDVASDTGASSKDRVKASEVILDRCGITPAGPETQTATAITVDVDFDERLARIVAGTGTKPA